MEVSKEVGSILEGAFQITLQQGYEYVTPEIILLSMCNDYIFRSAFTKAGGDVEELENDLIDYASKYLIGENHGKAQLSIASGEAIMTAQLYSQNCDKKVVEITHLLHGIWMLKDCYATYFMELNGVCETDLLEALADLSEHTISFGGNTGSGNLNPTYADSSAQKSYNMYAPCMNDMLDDVNPLIGREAELERTIQILCRKDKNNPIHIGEPGVGKTAITYGLARMINQANVPAPLQGAKIFMLDLGSLLAGTQYRGDLEKRLKALLEEISEEENPIIYIDEIHNMAGAGSVGESSFDISNILKPYLAQGKIRFIGATTYEEYKKYFEKNKSLVRRFQNVEISEPSAEETIRILEGLKKKYEKFHGVKYKKGVLEYAVNMSVKYINERYLPDKAIDLMDEAGAYRRIHPLDQKTQTVGKEVINEILTKICRVPIEQVKTEDQKDLKTLEDRMLAKIFGQDEAVSQVVQAIKYSRAGLLEDGKPLASLLFAGPTGVGKTEIAKTLANELGVKLVRFDMSEYGEKHTIAKLIGSPAGYVGYEEGGLLTEAIRKNPSSVLLIDEIEKAHPDIFNVLLQVMDYATLTDNQGRKADFRNVIIIMTSNAGASRIGKSVIGFNSQNISSGVIMEEVKRVFSPEFRNRLNKVVVFHHMNDEMAHDIADKKMHELSLLLEKKKVELIYGEDALQLLMKKGTSHEFGAREMDRIIEQEIKPLFVDELLFGKLKRGGRCKVLVKEGEFIAECEK